MIRITTVENNYNLTVGAESFTVTGMQFTQARRTPRKLKKKLNRKPKIKRVAPWLRK